MLDSDAELSDSAACLTLACSATVASPSILLHLACAADRACRPGTGVLHIRESLGPRAPHVCVRRCLRLCVCIDAQPEEGAGTAGSASTWHVLEHRRKAGDRVGRAAEDARCCDARVRCATPAPARYARMFARLVARVVLQAACDARAQFAQPLQPTARAEWSRWTRNVPRAERARLSKYFLICKITINLVQAPRDRSSS